MGTLEEKYFQYTCPPFGIPGTAVINRLNPDCPDEVNFPTIINGNNGELKVIGISIDATPGYVHKKKMYIPDGIKEIYFRRFDVDELNISDVHGAHRVALASVGHLTINKEIFSDILYESRNWFGRVRELVFSDGEPEEAIYKENGHELLWWPRGIQEEVVIPEHVTDIKVTAFTCNNVKRIFINHSTNFLEFSNCHELEEIIFGNNADVKQLRIDNCPKLCDVRLPENNIVDAYTIDSPKAVLHFPKGSDYVFNKFCAKRYTVEYAEGVTEINHPLDAPVYILPASLKTINSLKIHDSEITEKSREADSYPVIKQLYLKSETPPAFVSKSFKHGKYVTLHVPQGCVAAYRKSPIWKTCLIITDDCGELSDISQKQREADEIASEAQMRKAKLKSLEASHIKLKENKILGKWASEGMLYKSNSKTYDFGVRNWHSFKLKGENNMQLILRVDQAEEYDDALKEMSKVLEAIGKLLDNQDLLKRCEISLISGTFNHR